MALSYSEIITKFNEHLKKSGKKYYSDFYIGISNDAESRLFNQHHVSRDNSWWIYTTASSEKDARDVEKFFLDKGMRGGTGEETSNSKMVYCYAITPTTTE